MPQPLPGLATITSHWGFLSMLKLTQKMGAASLPARSLVLNTRWQGAAARVSPLRLRVAVLLCVSLAVLRRPESRLSRSTTAFRAAFLLGAESPGQDARWTETRDGLRLKSRGVKGKQN